MAAKWIKDGQGTLLTFSLFPTIKLYPTKVTPFGFDGGGPNSQTNMLNQTLRTQSPKVLVTLTAMKVTAQYNTELWDPTTGGINYLNKNGQCTVEWRDGATATFWGWIDKIDPKEVSEGEPPLVDVTVEPSNLDDDDEEALPEYTAAP